MILFRKQVSLVVDMHMVAPDTECTSSRLLKLETVSGSVKESSFPVGCRPGLRCGWISQLSILLNQYQTAWLKKQRLSLTGSQFRSLLEHTLID